MTADTQEARSHDELWDQEIQPRLYDREHDQWWSMLPQNDPELAQEIRVVLAARVRDINDQLGQHGAAFEAGTYNGSDDEFYDWRSRALGFKRVIMRRLGRLNAAGRSLDLAAEKARRREVHEAELQRQREGQERRSQSRRYASQATALKTLAYAVVEHQEATAPDEATLADRLLWGLLDSLTVLSAGRDGRDGGDVSLREEVTARREGRTARGLPPLTVLHAPRPETDR